MKGIMEAIPNYLYVIVGIAVALLMLALVIKYAPIFMESGDTITGSKMRVSEELASLAMKCWKKHRYGLDPESDVCYTLEIDSDGVVSELSVTEFLDCDILPNHNCLPDDCGFCSSEYYEDNERLEVEITTNKTKIKISYYGHSRKIGISEIREGKTTFIPTTTLVATTTEITSPGGTTTTTVGTTTTSVSTTTTSTTLPSQCIPETLASMVDSSIMIDNMDYLTQNARTYGGNWNSETADYIRDKLISYGLDNVHFEDFNSGWGRNVVGELGTGSNLIIVTGGHRDSVTGGPGAVDNAAGTATVMEAARVLSTCKNLLDNNKLIFVLFDGEEQGLLGSKAYVNRHSAEISSIRSMLNFDCVGYVGSNKIDAATSDTEMWDSVEKACTNLFLPCNMYSGSSVPDASDHAPFKWSGVPFFIAISNPFTCGPCYHSMSCPDDMSQVGSTQMEWGGKLAVYVLSDLYLE